MLEFAFQSEIWIAENFNLHSGILFCLVFLWFSNYLKFCCVSSWYLDFCWLHRPYKCWNLSNCQLYQTTFDEGIFFCAILLAVNTFSESIPNVDCTILSLLSHHAIFSIFVCYFSQIAFFTSGEDQTIRKQAAGQLCAVTLSIFMIFCHVAYSTSFAFVFHWAYDVSSMTCRDVTITSQTRYFEFETAILNPKHEVIQLTMTSPKINYFVLI